MFGLCATARSLLRRSDFRLFEAIEERWVTEDGHPVAP